MLVLSRKVGEKILIGNDIVVTVVAIDGNRTKIALEAPDQVRILRAELVNKGWQHRSDVAHDQLAGCC
ncbi:MAG: carbon storage regulator [Planctomycetes bacterium]|nr:carbon storage regulator [Planctomycetota bacterium]